MKSKQDVQCSVTFYQKMLSDNEIKEKKPCQPHTHIFFLKTHKTAGSTIMNILFRFGESHNLTIAFPVYNSAQFFYPQYFSAAFVEGYIQNPTRNFDIMCHHMRFHMGEVEKVMPKDTFYFTILRNPVSLMESSFIYFKGADIFLKAESLETFIWNPYKFYNKTSKYSHFGKNLMTFDLGFDHNGPESTKYFKLTQNALNTMFDLVLITEHFDESLVLLKEALCWSYDDVLSFPLNSREENNREILSVETQERIKIWNQLDWQLYVYFNKTFWEKVEKFGQERMQQEVEELRRRRAKQSDICIQNHVNANYIKDKSLKPYQTGLAKILGYNLKSGLGKAEMSLCQRLVTPELQYSEYLLRKQRQALPRTKNVFKVRRFLDNQNI
ncbi:galactose-3-O-sulfotransferase 2-like isoform X2 [Hyperolius riggenbachi]|uniref:galactose-3-O-sulfotransferase 2-like isoform X2 n=1 Tax=Hyperolius riggenbachi TaxID=752182 RepID=UPI0035A35D46